MAMPWRHALPARPVRAALVVGGRERLLAHGAGRRRCGDATLRDARQGAGGGARWLRRRRREIGGVAGWLVLRNGWPSGRGGGILLRVHPLAGNVGGVVLFVVGIFIVVFGGVDPADLRRGEDGLSVGDAAPMGVTGVGAIRVDVVLFFADGGAGGGGDVAASGGLSGDTARWLWRRKASGGQRLVNGGLG